ATPDEAEEPAYEEAPARREEDGRDSLPLFPAPSPCAVAFETAPSCTSYLRHGVGVSIPTDNVPNNGCGRCRFPTSLGHKERAARVASEVAMAGQLGGGQPSAT
ncbi:hypothetical protein THAOC_00144, partial [Thalassiosira oceanica]